MKILIIIVKNKQIDEFGAINIPFSDTFHPKIFEKGPIDIPNYDENPPIDIPESLNTHRYTMSIPVYQYSVSDPPEQESVYY